MTCHGIFQRRLANRSSPCRRRSEGGHGPTTTVTMMWRTAVFNPRRHTRSSAPPQNTSEIRPGADRHPREAPFLRSNRCACRNPAHVAAPGYRLFMGPKLRQEISEDVSSSDVPASYRHQRSGKGGRISSSTGGPGRTAPSRNARHSSAQALAASIIKQAR